MIAPLKKLDSEPFPKAKISNAIQAVLPKGKDFRLRIADAKIDRLKIVRVITPAWKSLRPAQRIEKIITAVNSHLTPGEQDRVLRYSVLTPDEYKDLVETPLQKGKASSKKAPAHKPSKKS